MVSIPTEIEAHKLPGVHLLPLTSLFVDDRFQRDPKPNWLSRKKKEGINWDAFRTLDVSAHPDGYYSILDGQQRADLCRLLGFSEAPCTVYSGLSFQEEARLFNLLNDSTGITRNDKFKARLAEGEPLAWALKQAVERAGFTVNFKSNKDIYSAAAIEDIYNWGGQSIEFVHRVFSVIHRAWANQPGVQTTTLSLQPVGWFLKVYPDVKNEFLIRVLRKIGSPLDMKPYMVRKGPNAKGYSPNVGAQVILEVYNSMMPDENGLLEALNLTKAVRARKRKSKDAQSNVTEKPKAPSTRAAAAA